MEVKDTILEGNELITCILACILISLVLKGLIVLFINDEHPRLRSRVFLRNSHFFFRGIVGIDMEYFIDAASEHKRLV